MVEEDHLLGVDVGTTATKVSLFDIKGNTIASETREYQLVTPSLLEVEVDIETLWTSFRKGVRDVLSKSNINPQTIKTLGISAQGETLVPLDREGKTLRNAIVWLDGRAQSEAEMLDRTFNDGKSYGITGQVKLVPAWPASKILWIKKHEPEIFRQVHKYMLVEDYFIWRMTSFFVSEGSLLCSTCYWNIVTKKWWPEMLDYLGISPDQLPEIREPGEEIGNVLPLVAKELGLSPNTIVSTGALDQACGTIGAGNIRPGIFTENIGAALAICATVEKPIFDKKRRMPLFYHGIPDTYMAHSFNTGGIALRWFRDSFCEAEMNKARSENVSPYQVIDREVSQVQPGSEGMTMLPHLQGAMIPESNPRAKGAFFGFTLRHSRAHFARSVMEAIACTIRNAIDILEDMGITVTEMRAIGGGARSDVWNQIVADITHRPVFTTVHDEDAACLGAAILAGKAAGLFKGLEEAVLDMVKIKREFEPDPNTYEIYDGLYSRYNRLYDSLLGLYETT